MPYFAVNFGMDDGYAHVIENDDNFPDHFAKVNYIRKKTFSTKASYSNVLSFNCNEGNNWWYFRFRSVGLA